MRLRRTVARAVGGVFGLSVEVVGGPSPGPAVYVANHLGWLDVIALATLLDGRIVAKREIASWPLLGRLIASLGAVFVDRDVPYRVLRFLAEGEAALRAGHSVLVFPEGTSGDGAIPRPFRTGAFALAKRVDGTPIVPIHVAVARVGGVPADAASARDMCWVGDEALVPSLGRVLRRGSVALRVAFGPPIDPTDLDRKHLARVAHDAVRALAPEVPHASA